MRSSPFNLLSFVVRARRGGGGALPSFEPLLRVLVEVGIFRVEGEELVMPSENIFISEVAGETSG